MYEEEKQKGREAVSETEGTKRITRISFYELFHRLFQYFEEYYKKK